MSKGNVFEQDYFRMHENPRLHPHEAMIDISMGRMSRGNISLLDVLSSLDNYPTEFIEYVDSSDDDDHDVYASPNNRYCGFAPHFLNRGFPKPFLYPHYIKPTKCITAEEAAKNAEELLNEEKKTKIKAEKKKKKKERQKQRRRLEKLEKENADKVDNKQVNPVKPKSAEGDCEDQNKSNNIPVVSSDSSNKDDEAQECEADEREELDLNSCFVTNAAAIAKRKLEQKARFERKDRKSENSKHRTAHQKSAAQPHNKEVEEEEEEEKKEERSLEAGNDFVTKSMEFAVMGNAYAQNGNLNMAVKYFTDAIRHNPKEYKLFGNRSYCYEKMQQYEKALIDADLALSLDPTWIKGLYRKGKALAGLKRYYEACVTYKEVLKLDSSCTDAAQELMMVQIMCLMEMGFTREQSSNALIIHGTVEKAIEALSGSNELHVEEEWVSLKKNPQPHKGAHKAVSQSQPGSNTVAKPSSLELFPIWVGDLVPGITSSMINEIFSRIGPVQSVKVLSDKYCAFVNYTNKEDCAKAIREMHGYPIAGTCLVVRYPDRIHTRLGVSKTASTDTGKVNKLPDECHFWRTTGCIKNNRCSYGHVPEHKGIDQPKTK